MEARDGVAEHGRGEQGHESPGSATHTTRLHHHNKHVSKKDIVELEHLNAMKNVIKQNAGEKVAHVWKLN